MIYVTHDQVEAMTLADRIVVLNPGRIEQIGAPLDLYHRPRNLFVASFIGSPRMNLVKGKVVAGDGTVALADGSQARLSKSRARAGGRRGGAIGMRPEHMSANAAGLVPLTGTVDVVERLGEASYVYMHLADGTNVTLAFPATAPCSRARH